jgi:malonate decarboxylase gamma subunit
MNGLAVFDRLFGTNGHSLANEDLFLQGTARIGDQDVVVIGTTQHAAIDVSLALRIAGAILEAVRADIGNPPRPIIFIADTQGQALSRHDELLGLNGYFAHIARCVDLARRHGHRLPTRFRVCRPCASNSRHRAQTPVIPRRVLPAVRG